MLIISCTYQKVVDSLSTFPEFSPVGGTGQVEDGQWMGEAPPVKWTLEGSVILQVHTYVKII